jgi:hypothetical protein
MDKPLDWLIWDYADGSRCLSKSNPFPQLVESKSVCRWLSMGGDAGPKPGHEQCQPNLEPVGLRLYREWVDDNMRYPNNRRMEVK